MTTTEMPGLLDYDASPELPMTPGERAVHDIMDIAMELEDPDSDLFKLFYDDERGVKPTPVWYLPEKINGHDVYIKDETSHQLTIDGETHDASAFKRRGAWMAALLALDENPQIESFVTASAGNHALGTAMAAKALGRQAHIYCKGDISPAKRTKLEALGAVIHADYETIEDALEAAEMASLSEKRRDGSDQAYRPNHFIHPFDQTAVMAGQASSALEWLASMEAAQAEGTVNLRDDDIEVIVPIGGGGLISAWAAVLHYARLSGRIGDNVRLTGAQMENCDAMNRAVNRLRRKRPAKDLFIGKELNAKCDGTAVNTPGEITLQVVREYVDDIVLVTPGELGEGMVEVSDIVNAEVEPAGGLAYTALKQRTAAGPDRTVGGRSMKVCVVSGANRAQSTLDYFTRQTEIEASVRAFRRVSALAIARNDDEHLDGRLNQIELLPPRSPERKAVSAPKQAQAVGLVCLNGATQREYVHMAQTA